MVRRKQHHGKQAVVEGSRLKTCDGRARLSALITDIVFARPPGLDHVSQDVSFHR